MWLKFCAIAYIIIYDSNYISECYSYIFSLGVTWAKALPPPINFNVNKRIDSSCMPICHGQYYSILSDKMSKFCFIILLTLTLMTDSFVYNESRFNGNSRCRVDGYLIYNLLFIICKKEKYQWTDFCHKQNNLP